MILKATGKRKKKKKQLERKATNAYKGTAARLRGNP